MAKHTGTGLVFVCICAAVIAACPVSALSAGLSPAKVEYSADRHVSMGDGNLMKAKVYSARDKERNEMQAGQAVTILRMDKKLMWTLMPEQKQYMEHKFSEQTQKERRADYRDCDVKQTDSGKETIDGYATRKTAVEISCPNQEKHTGTFWLTDDNIPIRMETSKVGAPKKDVVRVELKNLKIGKQDPALFEVPSGYSKFEMPKMPNVKDLQNMMKGLNR